MEFWQRAHWFATSMCNGNCRFCFKPEFQLEDSLEITKTLATTLAANDVREVIFTGGEPLLLKSLDSALEILGDSGIDMSIHTNATLLTPNRLKNLSKLVDEITIPIDSLDRQTQKYLRGTDCLPKVTEVFKQLQNKPVRRGIHTVATIRNINHMPEIYNFLNKGKFDYWRIYEYNPDLVGDKFSSVSRFREVQRLLGKKATAADGGINSLFADFLLMEEQMFKHQDKRIQFVGVKDYNREPYFFLDSGGDVHFCTWFLQGKRAYLGNILKEDFSRVKERAICADAQGPLFDEDAFVDSGNDSPLWARAAWDGNYFPEELEDVNPKDYKRFAHLSELYLNRLKKQGGAPEKAELTISSQHL